MMIPSAMEPKVRISTVYKAGAPVFFWTASLLIMTLVQPHVFHKLF